MAQNDTSQEKTEQATPKRLQDARRKGQVARSRDLTTMLMLIGAGLALVASAGHTGNALMSMMAGSFTQSREALFYPEAALDSLYAAIGQGLVAIAPLLVAMTVVAIAAPLALGGWAMSAEQIKFDVSKLDPIKGLGRVFGVRGLTEMLKALAKFLLIGVFAAAMLWRELDALGGLSSGDATQSVTRAFSIVAVTYFVVCTATVVIAVIDVPLQMWQHGRQLKMTRQEVKEEFKDTDGRPEIKSKLRQMQYEMASRRMMEEVPKADVVITNPTHYAVALKYDPDRMGAPRVVASGGDHMALAIRRVAAEHGVARVEAPMLARALYHTTKVGSEVPRELYLAVAQVLAYVFQIRDAGGGADLTPPDPDVPEGFRY